MTRPHRRDKDIRNASVCTGLRLEPTLAKRLCDEARKRALVGTPPRGDVAMMARALLREGLGIDAETSNTMEDQAPKPEGIAGLRFEAGLKRSLQRYAKAQGLSVTGAARHLLRVGLGYADKESRDIEQRFATLAAALREVRETL